MQDLEGTNGKRLKMVSADTQMTDAHGSTIEIDEDLHSRQVGLTVLVLMSSLLSVYPLDSEVAPCFVNVLL